MRKKNTFWTVLLVGLAFFIALGALGNLGDPNVGPDTDPNDADPVCAHDKLCALAIIDGGTSAEAVKYMCADCAELFVFSRYSNFRDNFPTAYTVTHEDGSSTLLPAYTGNWSVGYMNAGTFIPYNSFESGGVWLCLNGGNDKGLFRLFGATPDAVDYWNWMSFGLAWNANQGTTPVAINYQVAQPGTVALSATSFRFSNTADKYEFNVLLNGNPLLDEWVLIASDENGGINTKEALNALLAEKGLDSLHVSFGDQLSFCARAVDNQSVAQSVILPGLEYVASTT